MFGCFQNERTNLDTRTSKLFECTSYYAFIRFGIYFASHLPRCCHFYMTRYTLISKLTNSGGDLGVRITPRFWSAAASWAKVIRINPGKLCNQCYNLYFALYSSCVKISTHFRKITYDKECFRFIIDWIIVRKNYFKLICGILYPTFLANCSNILLKKHTLESTSGT